MGGQKEPFEPKKISVFVAIGGRWRVPGRPDTVRDQQGPPGIDILVKRNRLSKKKNSAFAALRLLEGPGEARHYQGPPGIDAWVKRNRLSQKKIRPLRPLWPLEAAGGSRGGPTLSGTIRDHQGSSFWSKETIWKKKKKKKKKKS